MPKNIMPEQNNSAWAAIREIEVYLCGLEDSEYKDKIQAVIDEVLGRA